MNYLLRWILLLGVSAAGLCLVSAAVAVFMRQASWDYLFVVERLPWEVVRDRSLVVRYGMRDGFRLAVFLGCWLALCGTFGRRPLPSLRHICGTACIAGCTVFATALLLGGAAYGYSKLIHPLVPPSLADQTGELYRVSCCYGLDYGRSIGGVLAAATAGGVLWRKRGGLTGLA
jgi:hypothetical protein